ncbi:uroporphyrinogen-III synthase [Erythrobacter sp. F6033]|uniref:uroporphyrinogen-III synthase n=1 Tax=Erythrobacter sp. F6033 TaxID=2926401 RepID=UPI001FF58CF5|nr:uroporphyrinogen-III synthase [Erythrobacter sp. F6033]
MTQIIAIRPEPGLSATVEAARALGLSVTAASLFEIRPLPWDAPDPAAIDGLLIGSANAIRHGGANLARFLDKPAYVVGKTTQKAAESAGFSVAATGSGGLQSLIDECALLAKMLRIAGADHVPLDPPSGVNIHKVIAYESAPLPLEKSVFDRSADRTIVLLHSAVAAEHFTSECKRLNIDTMKIELAVFGPRIASAAGKDWRAIHVAERADDAALLAMVSALCQ